MTSRKDYLQPGTTTQTRRVRERGATTAEYSLLAGLLVLTGITGMSKLLGLVSSSTVDVSTAMGAKVKPCPEKATLEALADIQQSQDRAQKADINRDGEVCATREVTTYTDPQGRQKEIENWTFSDNTIE